MMDNDSQTEIPVIAYAVSPARTPIRLFSVMVWLMPAWMIVVLIAVTVLMNDGVNGWFAATALALFGGVICSLRRERRLALYCFAMCVAFPFLLVAIALLTG